jgi:hypothetical protein
MNLTDIHITVYVFAFFLLIKGIWSFASNQKRLKSFKKAEAYRAKAGQVGENIVAKAISGLGKPIFHDVIFRYGKNNQYTMQIDHIVVGNDKLFVLETKNHKNLTDRLIQDSLSQNQTHVDVLSKMLNVATNGIVVLVGGAGREAEARLNLGEKLPYGMMPITRLTRNLSGLVRGKGYIDSNIKSAIVALSEFQNVNKQELTTQHVARVRGRYGQKPPKSAWLIMIIISLVAFFLAYDGFDAVLFHFYQGVNVM